jgi:hypothetical protein
MLTPDTAAVREGWIEYLLQILAPGAAISSSRHTRTPRPQSIASISALTPASPN